MSNAYYIFWKCSTFILGEIQSVNSSKRMKLSSTSQCDYVQQEMEHTGRRVKYEAATYPGFQSGKKLALAASDKDIDTDKQVQQRRGTYRHVPPREGRLSVSTSPNCCTSASPMNALDDTLYSQVSPATASTLMQSKAETGLQVSFVSFFPLIIRIHVYKVDTLFRTSLIEVVKQPDVKRKYLQVSVAYVNQPISVCCYNNIMAT